MDDRQVGGRCACGAVQYTFDGPIEEAHHCHCSVCRKAHGAAFATFARVRTARLAVTYGSEHLSRYRSTPPVVRTFCAVCGSSLFFAHDALPKFTWVTAGTLDHAGPELRPDAHVFVGSKAAWWVIEDGVPQHDEQRPEYQRKG